MSGHHNITVIDFTQDCFLHELPKDVLVRNKHSTPECGIYSKKYIGKKMSVYMEFQRLLFIY